jgi:hypothetical protein
MNTSEYLNENALDNIGADVPEKPLVFSHSVKIDQSAKGARVTVQVITDNFADARHQAVDLFLKVQQDLIVQGIPLAPCEAKNGVKFNG